MNKRGFIDDIDEEWLIALGMGIICGFIVLIMFHFGGAAFGTGMKVIGFIGGTITGTIASRVIFGMG